ncbi:MAG TPA: hypothetical protein VF671_13375 [Pseudomonas sp.]|jgi:cytochrome c-type biogenesis protein CcmE|uniref:hypothetical protein n=1 Tax=Pseudomonas sp. TaxID=306 RepID=UPI002ED80FF7
MDIALWIIAALIAVACYLLYLVLGTLAKLLRLTTIASDMNDENQRRVWSCVRRIHVVEHVLKGIRKQGLSEAEHLESFFKDQAHEQSIFDDEQSQQQMKI